MDKLEPDLGYKFNDKSLLKQALTHPSIAQKSAYVRLPDYERLEFLGDSVLSLVVTEMLLTEYKADDEGSLARKRSSLVCGHVLAEIASIINLCDYIIMSEGEERSGGKTNQRILENALEAVIGAMYLDGGLEVCKIFIKKFWQDKIIQTIEVPIDPKAHLQEWAQQHAKSIPSYAITQQEGPPHKPVFTIEVKVDDMPSFTAQGGSRKIAEKIAAQNMLNYIKDNNDKSKN